jgi:ankyrin repeat protein
MHLACQAGNLEFIKLLIEYGADINAVQTYNNLG